MPSTEVAIFPLVEGSDISDPENATHISLEKCFNIVAEQDGLLQYHLGMQVENPNMLESMINWTSTDKHEEWKTKPQHGPVAADVATVFAGPGPIYHASFYPISNSLAAFTAPITERTTLYFENGPPSDYMDDFAKVLELLKDTPGIITAAAGFTEEELEFERFEGGKGKGKAIIVLVGWESLGKHEVFEQTEGFERVAALLRSSANGAETHHIKFVMHGGKEFKN